MLELPFFVWAWEPARPGAPPSLTEHERCTFGQRAWAAGQVPHEKQVGRQPVGDVSEEVFTDQHPIRCRESKRSGLAGPQLCHRHQRDRPVVSTTARDHANDGELWRRLRLQFAREPAEHAWRQRSHRLVALGLQPFPDLQQQRGRTAAEWVAQCREVFHAFDPQVADRAVQPAITGML